MESQGSLLRPRDVLVVMACLLSRYAGYADGAGLLNLPKEEPVPIERNHIQLEKYIMPEQKSFSKHEIPCLSVMLAERGSLKI